MSQAVIIPVLCLLVAGTWLAAKIFTDDLLNKDATEAARIWAEFLAVNVPDLEQIAAGELRSNASLSFFEATSKAGQVFGYVIYSKAPGTGRRAAFRLFSRRNSGTTITTLIPLNCLNEERTILDRIARGERIEHYETVRKRKDGVLFPISLTISPIKDLGGEIVGASKIARDISAQKLKEEHIALLSREVDHRSKNLLSLVQAAVHFARGDTPDDLKRTIEGRVQALANAHALLEESQWTGAEIRTLFAKELLPYASAAATRVEIIGPTDVEVEIGAVDCHRCS